MYPPLFTADQMRDYGEARAAAEREVAQQRGESVFAQQTAAYRDSMRWNGLRLTDAGAKLPDGTPLYAALSKSAPGIDASAGCVEPVAWRARIGSQWFHGGDKLALVNALSVMTDGEIEAVEPLFAAAPQQRQPLTLERICELQADCMYWSEAEQRLRLNAVEFARAVEAAHGIKETK
jgi:hypothetical protein